MSLNLITVNFKADDADKLFFRSICDTGFAIIKNHPISIPFVTEIYKEWSVFFVKPNKLSFLYDEENLTGYFPFRSENAKYTSIKNLMEFFQYRPGCCIPEGVSNNVYHLFNSMRSLGSILLQWIENNLPKEKKDKLQMSLKEMVIDSKRTILRILHYPALTGDEELGAMRSAPHEDINLLTLLPPATAKGLQIQDNQGQWHDIPYDADSIIVNSGEMLAALTNEYIPATTHQVINPQGELIKKARLSLPLFLHPRDEIKLPYGMTAYDFLMERVKITLP